MIKDFSNEKLKECPLCNGTGELKRVEDEFYTFFVECTNCDYRGGSGFDEDEAINEWNAEVENIKNTKLKPCPFCGHKAQFCVDKAYHAVYIECICCETRSRLWGTASYAANGWNRRTKAKND